MLMLLSGGLLVTPMPENPQRILDLGTRTGARGIDCAELVSFM
jgi:hypothetical protein